MTHLPDLVVTKSSCKENRQLFIPYDLLEFFLHSYLKPPYSGPQIGEQEEALSRIFPSLSIDFFRVFRISGNPVR